MALPTLNDDQRLYLQTIFDYFHEHGKWPTYRYVDRKLTQIRRDLDIEKIAKSLPSGFASTSSYNLRLDDEAILSISAIYLCVGSGEELADFIKVLHFCVEKYFSVGEDTVQISSDDLRQHLDMSELSVRKVGLLIKNAYDYYIYTQFGYKDNEDNSWVLTLSRNIREFDGVTSIEQYLEKLDQIKQTFVTPVPMLSQSVEDTDTLSGDELERLLAEIGYRYVETSSLEIKENVPSAKELARLMAAFANADGGIIIIGMTDNFRIVGVPDDTPLEGLYQEAISSLSPHPLMNYRFADIRGAQIFIITVQKYPVPILTKDQRYYVRKGNKTSLAEEDLIDALSESVPSFKTNILNSLEEEPHAEKSEDIGGASLSQSVVLGSENIFSGSIDEIAGGNINRVVHETIMLKPQLDLNELLKDTIERTRDDLTTQRRERLQQARITFIVALIVLVLAIILVFIGVILIFTNKIQAGVVSSVASIVSGIVSGLALTFNKQTNDRLDEYARELVALEKSYTGMQYLSLITDVRMKDEAIRDLAKGISLGNQVSK